MKITIAIDGDKVEYVVRETTATKRADGFGTISVLESGAKRLVLVRPEHLEWQTGRYQSCPARDVYREYIHNILRKRIAGIADDE